MPLATCLVMEGVEESVWLKPLTKRRATLGRSRSCDIHIRDRNVSRVHAEIQWRAGTYFLIDLGSKNGCYLNGKRYKEVPFEVGDTLTLASVSLNVVSRVIGKRSPRDPETSTHSFELAGDESEGFTILLEVIKRFQLSRAQSRVVRYLLQGMAEKEIAAKLHLSPHTVHTHAKNIYRALQVHSRAELLARYWAHPKTKPRRRRRG